MIDAVRCFTPPQLAKRWRKSPEQIICLIRAGKLRAFDSSLNPGYGRPRFLITPEAVAEFENAPERTGCTEKPMKRKKRQLVDLDSI